MRSKIIAAAAAAVFLSAGALTAFADYGYEDYNTDYGYGDYNDYNYDYNTDTDYTYDDTYTGYGTYDTETSSTDPTQDHPTVVSLTPTKIKDMKFSAALKIKNKKPITAADITINYDADVFKVTGNQVHEEAGGEAAATDMGSGVFQYIYTNTAGSEYDGDYLTIDFQILDPTVRSSVLYITVNSILDGDSQSITATADGTIIQIEGAVPADASADESMYTELRVAKSDQTITFSSLGLKDVKSVTFEDGSLATADDKGISTLAEGLTNMTVEFNDGTFKYYRLVISTQSAVTQTESAAEAGATIENAADTNATSVTKTESGSSERTKKFVIFLLVLLAIAALIIEYFAVFGNPYKRYALRSNIKPKPEKEPQTPIDDDDFFPEEPDRSEDTEGDEEEVAEADEADTEEYEEAESEEETEEYSEEEAEEYEESEPEAEAAKDEGSDENEEK